MPSPAPLYAVRSYDCWVVCNARVSLGEALQDRYFVGTWLSSSPPRDWYGRKVIPLNRWKEAA